MKYTELIESGAKQTEIQAYLAEGDKTDLTIKITQDDWNKAAAGHYGDTVIFDVAYTTNA